MFSLLRTVTWAGKRCPARRDAVGDVPTHVPTPWHCCTADPCKVAVPKAHRRDAGWPHYLGSAPARHLSYAAAAGASVIVTRDIDAITRLGRAAAAVGVAMVTPQELVALVDEIEDAPSYHPARLMGTGYSVREATAGDQAALKAFLANASGESAAGFRRVAGDLAQGRPASHRLLVLDPAGEPVALVGTAPSGRALLVPLLRLRAVPLRSTIAAQLAARLRALAAEAGLSVIRIIDPHLGDDVADAVLSDGFRRTRAGQLAAITLPEHGSARRIADAVRGPRAAGP